MPECSWEGDVCFFQASVGDAVDGLEKSIWEWWDECVRIALEPAEWASHDYFVEGVLFSCGGRHGDLVLAWVRVVSWWCFHAYNGLIELDIDVRLC